MNTHVKERFDEYVKTLPASAYWDLQHRGLEDWAICEFAESEVRLALDERERQQRSGNASDMCGPGKCQRLEYARKNHP